MTNTMKNTYYYPLITWVLTILIAPITWMVFRIIKTGGGTLSWLETLPVFFIVGLMYSLPTFGVFVLIYEILKRKRVSDFFLKGLLMIICVLGIFLTFWYISGTISMELAIFYSINMTILVWIIRMNRNFRTTDNPDQSSFSNRNSNA